MKSSTPFEALGAALALLLLAGCTGTPLYSELEEQQANQVMAAMLSGGISATKELSPSKNGFEVRIASADIPAAMEILHRRGLPARTSPTLGELFKNEKFASSAIEERARYRNGLQEDIRRSLMAVPGVVDANVLVATPVSNPISEKPAETSASVLINVAPGVDLTDRETDMKMFIRDGVEGLTDVNKITIKFFTVGGSAAPQKQAMQAGGKGGPAAMLSGVNPLTIGIAVGAAVLLGLLMALIGRLRRREPAAAAAPRGWNG